MDICIASNLGAPANFALLFATKKIILSDALADQRFKDVSPEHITEHVPTNTRDRSLTSCNE